MPPIGTTSTTDMSVDRITLDDVDQAVDLFLGYLEFYQRPSERGAALDFLRARLGQGESAIFLATHAGRPVGFTQVYPTFSSVSMAPVWILNDLFVTPQARNRGVGRALIKTVMAEAAAAGAVRVTLDTAEDNTTAQALYESEGFVTGHPVRYYVKRTQ